MRVTLLSMLLVTASAAQDHGSAVTFSNGDQLSGKVISLSMDSLEWDSPVLAEPAGFGLESVIDLRMSPGEMAGLGLDSGHTATLEMTNGDIFHGQLAGLSDEEIRLNTLYAGELVFRRVNVEQVKISSEGKVLYRGPHSMEGWTQSNSRSPWSYKSGALQVESAGGIAREIDFPEQCSISFTAAWKGTFRPKILFYTDDVEVLNPNHGFSMEFLGNSVHLKALNGGELLGRPKNAPMLRNMEKADFEIRVSEKRKEVLLFIDGELMGVWEADEVDMQKFGKGFHIVSHDRTPVRFSKIKVTEWDGYVDEERKRQIALQNDLQFGNGLGIDENAPAEAVEEAEQDGRMIFRNGDSIKGEVTKVNGDEITVKTSFTDVTFPMSRLKNVVLKKADMETPIRKCGDVRATLIDDSKIVFRLDGVEADRLLGFSQNFGNAAFRRDAFKRIEFNIYDKKLEKLRVLNDW